MSNKDTKKREDAKKNFYYRVKHITKGFEHAVQRRRALE